MKKFNLELEVDDRIAEFGEGDADAIARTLENIAKLIRNGNVLVSGDKRAVIYGSSFSEKDGVRPIVGNYSLT